MSSATFLLREQKKASESGCFGKVATIYYRRQNSMNTKTCSKCKEEKPTENFGKNKRKKDNLSSWCKSCDSQIQQERYWKKKGGKPQVIIPEELEGKVRITAEHNIRYLACIDCGKKKNERGGSKLPRCYSCGAKKRDAQYNQREGFRICKKCDEEKELNKDNFHFVKGKDILSGTCKACWNKRQRKRIHSTAANKLRHRVSKTINRALRRAEGSKKGNSIIKYLPYSIAQLKEHLESQFEAGMSWENWGFGEDCWHIDHIYPHSKLPYDTMEHPNFQKAWSLSNLRPLWQTENLAKSDKIIKELIDPDLFP
jgi:hypothetical protein